MRKYIITSVLLTMLLLASCSKKDDDYRTINSSEVSNQLDPSITPEVITEEDILYESLNDVTDAFELIDSTHDVLEEIGVEQIKSVIITEQRDTAGTLDINYTIETEKYKLDFSAMKISIISDNEWEVSTVSDTDTNKYYWLREGLDDYMDLYDYKTGELISSGEKELDPDKLMQEYEEKNKEILKDFEEDLQDLAEEYNLE